MPTPSIDIIIPPSPPAIDITPPDCPTIDVKTSVGIPGPPGPIGPQGPPGPGSGGGTYFYFTQPTASPTWVIVHNLGYYPNVAVTDSTGREIIPEVFYTNASTVTLTFVPAAAGQAFLT